MERFNANVDAFESPLYETPKILKAIGMNFSMYVSVGMVNDLVNVICVQSAIGMAIICREMRAALDVIFHQSMKRRALTVWQNLGSYFSFALQNSAHDYFIRHAFSKAFCAGF